VFDHYWLRLDEAKAKFAETWRAWLRQNRLWSGDAGSRRRPEAEAAAKQNG
jgi:hypothetical protein